MPGQRRFVIDACVIIDLYRGGILRDCLHSSFIFETTDFVVNRELIVPDGSYVVRHGLRERQLLGDRVSQILDLRSQHVELSVPDASLIVLSLMHNSILLTKNQHLVLAAEEQDVQTNGTLWLMDQLVESGSLGAETALRAVIRMSLEARQLDSEEVSIYRTKWQRLC